MLSRLFYAQKRFGVKLFWLHVEHLRSEMFRSVTHLTAERRTLMSQDPRPTDKPADPNAPKPNPQPQPNQPK